MKLDVADPWSDWTSWGTIVFLPFACTQRNSPTSLVVR
jgi:hypothetical protein